MTAAEELQMVVDLVTDPDNCFTDDDCLQLRGLLMAVVHCDDRRDWRAVVDLAQSLARGHERRRG
jgi:hypothetical protein